MDYESLSKEAKETLIAMVEHCLNSGLKMGMDEGIQCFETGKKHNFRTELEKFVKSNQA
ncbi:hypothetical protein NB550_11580 [Vibrio parahaemolyticus]|jgi:hypothetical protein|uniref:hypothetical protein n=1 Tax=Vibrio parahaemolyticus TaxID=670 RepID=UPI0011AC3EF4|nr:hypothetical protein [Vibrio parahaemolyticus]MCR9888202.1 hypothetical protein [Vibrio parahaemolyticus]MCR9918132.1 hypothetical protein [Vibrio parahaemolyticus]